MERHERLDAGQDQVEAALALKPVVHQHAGGAQDEGRHEVRVGARVEEGDQDEQVGRGQSAVSPEASQGRPEGVVDSRHRLDRLAER